MGSLGGRGAGGGAGGKVGLSATGLSLVSPQQQATPASHFTPAEVSFRNKKSAVRQLPHKAEGQCKLKDFRRRAVDLDGKFLKFHTGKYEMGDLKSKCLVNKWSTENPIDFCGYSILKNVRHSTIISLENFYDESGQARIVMSWVDGSLSAWVCQGGYQKSFRTAAKFNGSCPTRAFRRMMIDTCKAMEHMFRENLYPSAINASNLYICNEKQREEGSLLKMLICQADRLSDITDKNIRKCKLWRDVKNIFEDICKESNLMLTVATKSFVDYIGAGSADKLEGFPDIWSSRKKECYLFSVLAADRSIVRPRLNQGKFAWPTCQLIADLLHYEMTKQNPTQYDVNDGYDYLRLCRNVLKHWKQFCANVSLLKVSCPTRVAFVEKMEEFNPRVWCDLYTEVGWPEGV